jgi:neutral ceramidase
VTTHEEYDRQDYEGASTHFGPWTLAAVQQTVAQLASSLATGREVNSDIEPSTPPDTLLDLQTSVLLDASPLGKALGSVWKDALPSYQTGQKVVVSFWAGHPKNDFRIQGTFLNVQRRQGDRWIDIVSDHNPETRFIWRRWPLFCLPYSTATVEWRIPANIVPGTYRVSIYGEGKRLFGPLRSYAGTSGEFRVS